MISRIHIIRHGMTEGNLKRLMYSNTDLPLIQEGVDEIAELAAHNVYPVCENVEFYTSGLLRTEQTLLLIYGEIEHEQIRDLREMEFGKYENRTFDDLLKDPEYVEWMSDETGESVIPGGESMNGFKARVISGFEEVLDEHFARVRDAEDADKAPDCIDSIVICHGGPIAAIMEHCFPEEKDNMYKWMPEPGHGHTIEYKDGKPARHDEF